MVCGGESSESGWWLWCGSGAGSSCGASEYDGLDHQDAVAFLRCRNDMVIIHLFHSALVINMNLTKKMRISAVNENLSCLIYEA
jgi:hypothetical protein